MFIFYVLCCENSIVTNFVICVTSIVPIATILHYCLFPWAMRHSPSAPAPLSKPPFWHCHVFNPLFETVLEKGGQSGAIRAPVRLID